MMNETAGENQMGKVPSLTHCPNCSSEYVLFIHRPQQAKVVYHRKRYLCIDCSSGFYVESHDHGSETVNETIQEHQRHFDFFRARWVKVAE